jgi:hypothetical protein
MEVQHNQCTQTSFQSKVGFAVSSLKTGMFHGKTGKKSPENGDVFYYIETFLSRECALILATSSTIRQAISKTLKHLW